MTQKHKVQAHTNGGTKSIVCLSNIGINMSSKIITRKMTSDERSKLEEISGLVTLKKKWLQGAENTLVLWSATLLAIFMLGGLVVFLIEKIFDINVLFSSEITVWGLSILIIGSGVYAIISSYNWIKNWGDFKPLIIEDLKHSNIFQETLEITEIKKFQEIEHGGIIYFLHNKDGRVFVLQHSDYHINPDDRIPFIIKRKLKIAYAPKSNFMLSTDFSGEIIDSEKLFKLTVPPNKWPEEHTWCNIRWDDLEKTLSP